MIQSISFGRRLALGLRLLLGIDSPSASLVESFEVAREIAETEQGQLVELLRAEIEEGQRKLSAMHRRAQAAEGVASLLARDYLGFGYPRQKRSLGCVSQRAVGDVARAAYRGPR